MNLVESYRDPSIFPNKKKANLSFAMIRTDNDFD